ncbi:MAG: hypothetical protein Q6366_015890 [Candidatus Freyarchaeota archaeon]
MNYRGPEMERSYLGIMGRGRLLIRVMVFVGFLLGLLIYFWGLTAGFFQSSAFYIEYWAKSGTYALGQFLLFEEYPRFLLVLLPVFLVAGRFTPLTLAFLTFALGAVASISLNKVRIAVFCGVSASLIALTQCICILPFVGGEPMGLTFRVPLLFFNVCMMLLSLFSSKNLYLLIVPAMLFMVGAFTLFFWRIREKMVTLGREPLSSMHFKTLKSFSSDHGIILPPLIIFLFASYLQTQIIQTEFPHYPLLATFSQVYSSDEPSLLIFWILYFSILLTILRIQRQGVERLAGQCTAILAKDWQKQKPVISLSKVMELFGLESVDRRLLKQVLFRAAEIAEQDGSVYFGTTGNYLYFEYPLVQLVKEKLGELGELNMREMALELQLEPAVMRRICRRLKVKELLRDVNITRDTIVFYDKKGHILRRG